MFEKEAEAKYCKGCKLRIEQCLWAWRNTNGLNEPNKKNCSCKEVPAYIAGAEFAYKKANEWHDLRKNPNDLPKECKCKGKPYLVNIYSDSQLKFKYAEYTPTVCLWDSEWKRFEILELTVGSRIVNIKDVIAWKEIVLPELKESE